MIATIVGPNLNELFGRRSGTSYGYSHSAANKDMTVVWEESILQDYLVDPEKVCSSKIIAILCMIQTIIDAVESSAWI